MSHEPNISDKAVSDATGWSWNEWFTMIDEEGGKEMEHSEIAKILRVKGELKNDWWCQAITVEYERSRGLRQVGQTADTLFEVGVRRTFDTTPRRAWETITKGKGLESWLGKHTPFTWEKGQTYETEDGASGEIRTVRPGSHVRLTWRPIGWDEPSIIQVSVIPVSRTATISFHQEKIPTDKDRQKMRARWNKALDALVDLL